MTRRCAKRRCRPFFFFQAEDGIRDSSVTGVQTCALPIYQYYQPWRFMESVLNSYPCLVSSRSSSALSRPTALLPFPCQTNHLACSISFSTDSLSSEPIILLPNTERLASLNFIATCDHSRML